VTGFTVLGLAATILVEILATQVWHRWRYSSLMPTIPILEVGLIPLLMWGVARARRTGRVAPAL
jgi:hypothetical protein